MRRHSRMSCPVGRVLFMPHGVPRPGLLHKPAQRSVRETGLTARVEETLRKDIWRWQEIRAAAYVLVQLGRQGIWPADELESHLRPAINRLDEILTEAVANGADEDWAGGVIDELDVLRSRLAPPTVEPSPRLRCGKQAARVRPRHPAQGLAAQLR